MLDVFLLRHAHVDYAPPAQITAHNPLTPLGRQMATRLAQRCAEWDLQYLFVSTMLRAQQTGDAISERLPGLPRLDMAELEEIGVADLEGYAHPPCPEDLGRWTNRHFEYARPRSWERVRAGWERVLRVAEHGALERVAILSHEGPLNTMLSFFMGEDAYRPRTWWCAFGWTATSCLRYTPEDSWMQKRILWINDTRHIDDLAYLLVQGGPWAPV
jgi:broad specificity phosphatase PhoE